MTTTPAEKSDKENSTPPPTGTQQAQDVRVGPDNVMKILESICEPEALTRTKSGNGFLMKSSLAAKLCQTPKGSQGYRRTTVTVPEFNQKHTKALPFNSRVMEQYLDLNNCTYAVIGYRSALGQAIQGKHGVKMFAKSEFFLDSRYEENDPYDDMDEEDDVDDLKDEKDEATEKQPLTTPSLPLGVHETVFKETQIFLLYQEIGDPQGGGYGDPSAPKTMVLFTAGRNNLERIQLFAHHLLKLCSDAPKKQSFHLYRWQHGCGYWKLISSEKARPMNSVIMPVGFRESVELDMKRFLSKNTRAWYDRRGIPYKRCYMFWGVPGTGKTSLITALAGRFRRNVCFLSAHHPKFTDEALKSALSRVPSRAIVVLEDIDSLFDKDRKSNNGNNPLTFTGLLNAVDGIGEHRGTIFVMTTNYIDRLDSALIRAGRVDMKVEFKHADDYQLAEYFKWFYDESKEEAEKFAPLWVEACRKQFPDGVTMAELQQHFVDNMYSDAEACVNNLKFYELPLLQKQAAAEKEKREKEEAKKKEEEEERKRKKEDRRQKRRQKRKKKKAEEEGKKTNETEKGGDGDDEKEEDGGSNTE